MIAMMASVVRAVSVDARVVFWGERAMFGWVFLGWLVWFRRVAWAGWAGTSEENTFALGNWIVLFYIYARRSGQTYDAGSLNVPPGQPGVYYVFC